MTEKMYTSKHLLGVAAAVSLAAFLFGLMIGRVTPARPAGNDGERETIAASGAAPADDEVPMDDELPIERTRPAHSGKPFEYNGYAVGGSYELGGFQWRILDIRDGNALLITEDLIEERPYDPKKGNVQWETCALRSYLNEVFFKNFSAAERAIVVETELNNRLNKYGTDGGNDTIDRVFVLSVDEAEKYFRNNDDRAALYADEESHRYGSKWWYLRTPDAYEPEKNIAVVSYSGSFSRMQVGVQNYSVRPALWVNLDGNSQPTRPATKPAATTAKAPRTDANGTILAEIAELYGEEDNPQYKGKTVEVQGLAHYIAKQIGGFCIALDAYTGNDKIECYFADRAEIAKMAELRKDSHVIVTGKFTGGKLQACKVRMADGSKIEPTPVPKTKNGVWECTVGEFKALDLERNNARGEFLLENIRVKITAKVTGFDRTYNQIFSDRYYIYIGTPGETIKCRVYYRDYEAVSQGDTVTVTGEYVEIIWADLDVQTVTIKQ